MTTEEKHLVKQIKQFVNEATSVQEIKAYEKVIDYLMKKAYVRSTLNGPTEDKG